MIALALIALALPGVALAAWTGGARRDPTALLATAGLGAAGSWIVAFWVLAYVPMGLAGLAAVVGGASAVAIAIGWRRLRHTLRELSWSRNHLIALAVFGGVLLLRLIPVLAAAAAPGADMAMHSYMTRLIAAADGVPASYHPLLPIDEFGAYAAGLPSLGALLARLSGAGVVGAAALVACLTHVAVSAAVYLWCRLRFGPLLALAATLVATLATRDPQAHFLWGGNPTVLSLAMATLGLVAIEQLETERWRGWLLPGALGLTASLLSHSVLPYALAYILPPVLAVGLWRRPPGKRIVLLRRGAALLGLTILIALPYLVRFDLSLTGAEKLWIQNWQRLPSHVPPGPPWLAPVAIFWHIARRLGAPFLVLLAGAVAARVWGRRRDSVTEELVFGAIVLALVLNALVWVLPASYALYPDRIMLLLVLPGARIIASGLAGLRERLTGRRWAPAATWIVVAGACAFGSYNWYLSGLGNVSVTDDDLTVAAWIDANLPAGEVLENNYGDAGIWLPALIGRPVRTGHVNIVYKDEVDPWRERVRPRFLFIGARLVYEGPESPYQLRAVLERPDRYQLLLRQGDAAVFRIRGR